MWSRAPRDRVGCSPVARRVGACLLVMLAPAGGVHVPGRRFRRARPDRITGSSSTPTRSPARSTGASSARTCPLGSCPSWSTDEGFRELAVASGTTLLRLPGGSWSNHYDWLGCELGDPQRCDWTWAMRPSDFLGLLEATGLPAMWTVSINGTAEEAAAAVAFFNGDVDDDRPIGTDRNGRDWLTVGHWAQLRADHGHPEAGADSLLGDRQRGLRRRQVGGAGVRVVGLGGRMDLRRHRVRRGHGGPRRISSSSARRCGQSTPTSRSARWVSATGARGATGTTR